MDTALAACKLLISEETCDAVTHFQHHHVADIAVVAKEEKQTVATFRKAVDADVVAQRMPFEWHILQESQRTVEQAIDAIPFILEVDTEIADEQQVALPALDADRPRDLSVGAVPSVKRDVVFGRHRAGFVDVRFALELGDAINKQIGQHRQPHAARVAVDNGKFFAKHRHNAAACIFD